MAVADLANAAEEHRTADCATAAGKPASRRWPFSATAAKPLEKPAEPKKQSRLALLVAGIAALIALALLVIAVGAWHFLGANRSALVAAPTVAVLPFDNLGGDEQASRLADGMTEDVITNLARNKDILVIARNSTMPYKGKPVDTRQIAKTLTSATCWLAPFSIRLTNCG
jgi:hypothetical protein